MFEIGEVFSLHFLEMEAQALLKRNKSHTHSEACVAAAFLFYRKLFDAFLAIPQPMPRAAWIMHPRDIPFSVDNASGSNGQ